MFFTVQNGSSNINLTSEQVIIRDIVSPSTLSLFSVFESSEEPEDAILVNSGILQRLIAQAQQEHPLSLSDWEQKLDKL